MASLRRSGEPALLCAWTGCGRSFTKRQHLQRHERSRGLPLALAFVGWRIERFANVPSHDRCEGHKTRMPGLREAVRTKVNFCLESLIYASLKFVLTYPLVSGM